MRSSPPKSPLRSCLPPLLLLAVLLLGVRPTMAQTIALEGGRGQSVDVQTIALRVPFCTSCLLLFPSHTSMSLELAAIAFQGRKHDELNDKVYALGIMPLLRYGWPDRDGAVYVEDGFGVRLISHTRLYDERRLSTNFQFGELLGAGYRFGAHHDVEVGLRLQHMSNGEIKKPNNGVSFASMRVAMRW